MIPIKGMDKQERERHVLLGTVDFYIRTGKPVGSNTLRESGFEDLSSATIRNYFAHLEEEGYLEQAHASGGRIPTNLAYRFYANYHQNKKQTPDSHDLHLFASLDQFDSREMALFLQNAAEQLSQKTQCAVFLSAPRFDSDYLTDMKLVAIDHTRCLCILMTDFGLIRTEILHLPSKLSSFSIKRIENYFQWRLTGLDKPEHLDKEEELLAHSLYNEMIVRYLVGYSNFIDEDIYRTGFSKLLHYPDFQEASTLASALALFENTNGMRLLLRECKVVNRLKFWIGDDLVPHAITNPNCSILTIPYYVNRQPVGAIGLLGPSRMPYANLFQKLDTFSKVVSDTLTRNIYKFKINYRQPEAGQTFLEKDNCHLTDQTNLILLEDKSNTFFK